MIIKLGNIQEIALQGYSCETAFVQPSLVSWTPIGDRMGAYLHQQETLEIASLSYFYLGGAKCVIQKSQKAQGQS